MNTTVKNLDTLEVGAWYRAQDVNEINRIFGREAADYLSIPRRACKVIHRKNSANLVQFQTLGDSTPAYGMLNKATDTPTWSAFWLKKVKSPCNVEGERYKVYPGWRDDAIRRQRNNPNKNFTQFLNPDFADKIVTASHESYSGISVWVYDDQGQLACIPKLYLKSGPASIADQMATETLSKGAQHILNSKYKVVNCSVPDTFKLNDKIKQELVDIGVFPAVDPKESSTKGSISLEDFTKELVKENDMDNGKINIMDEKIRMLESRLNEYENEDYSEVDPENDLEHSMVLDLPPNIAEWAKEAGVGLEDMLPLATEICKLQSEMHTNIQQILSSTEVNKELTSRDHAAADERTVQAGINSELKQRLSGYRHETLRVLVKWVAGASTISYLAHIASGLF